MRKLQVKPFEVGVTEAQPRYLGTKHKPIPSIAVKKPKELRQQRVIEGLRRLEAQAERINQLSAELEIAMIELKTISSEVKRHMRTMQTGNKPIPNGDICECISSIVPYVGQKPCGSLLLTTRPVDLFKPEREAALIAKELREQVRRKQRKGKGSYIKSV